MTKRPLLGLFVVTTLCVELVGHAAPAAAQLAPEIVIPAATAYQPRQDVLVGVGASGVLHVVQDTDFLGKVVWTTQDGNSTELEASKYHLQTDLTVAGADVLIRPIKNAANAVERVELTPIATMIPTSVSLGGLTYWDTYGQTVIATDANSWASGRHVFLLRAVDGATVSQPVTGLPSGELRLVAGDATSVVVDTSSYETGLIDLATGAYTKLASKPDSSPMNGAQLTPTHLVFHPYASGAIWVIPRSGGNPGQVNSPTQYGELLGMAGDWVLAGNHTSADFAPWGTQKLVAMPIVGGTAQTLLSRPSWIATLPSGVALANAGPSAADRGIYKISATADGAPATQKLMVLPPKSAKILKLALGPDRLMMVDDSAYLGRLGYRAIDSATMTVGPVQTLSVGGASICPPSACTTISASGSRMAYSTASNVATLKVSRDVEPAIPLMTSNGDFPVGRFSGGFLELDRLVLNVDTGAVAYEAPDPTNYRTFALWGNLLWLKQAWNAGPSIADSGLLTAHDLRSGATFTVQTPARCQPVDFTGDIVGRWVYWRCPGADGPLTGVHDILTGRNIAVPAAPNSSGWRLGDGFMTTNIDHNLYYVDLTASDAPQLQFIADMGVQPPGSIDVNNGWGSRWTVDRYGSQRIAYVDAADMSIHIVPVPVRASGLTRVDVVVPASVRPGQQWLPWWEMSKPASWTLTVRDWRGVVTRRSGTTEGTMINPGSVGLGRGWNTWTLTVTPRDGQGSVMTMGGSVNNLTSVPRRGGGYRR